MSSTGPPPAPTAPPADAPDETVRVLLSISRSLALIFAILAGLLFLLLVSLTVLDVVFGRGPGDIVAAGYCLVSAAVDFVVWRELPRLEQIAARREYGALRRPLLIWAILALVFFVVVGILMLVAWVRVETLVSPKPSS